MDALTSMVFHSTKARFDPAEMKTPAYFADDREWTGAWGREVVSAKLKLSNPYVCVNEGMHFEALYDEEFVNDLKSDGYDSVILRNDGRPTIYVAFSQDQIIEPKFEERIAFPSDVAVMTRAMTIGGRSR